MTHEHSYGETLLTIEDVHLSFDGGKTEVLKGVNAEVRNIMRPGLTQGQVIALMGPSGVGKTQLFRILAGQQKATKGRILIGEDGHETAEGLMGVVPQKYCLFDHRSVWGNLMVAARQGGMPQKEAEEKADALLERFQVHARKHAYPKELSGGQKQRVAIIRQLLCSDAFLLMDEPTAALDPVNKDEVCEMVSEVAALDELMTIIVVTHDISAAIQMADHVWLLGRDRDENGKPVPGARIKYRHDLIARGLAWRKGITSTPEFAQLRNEIRAQFNDL